MVGERIVFFHPGRAVQTVRDFQALSHGRFPLDLGYGGGACLDRESGLGGAAGSVTAVAATSVGMGSRTGCPWRFRGNRSVSGFHVCTAIAFVCADSAKARGGSGATAWGVRKGAGAFELAEDGFFVRKEVPNKAVAMSFVHGEGGFCTRA